MEDVKEIGLWLVFIIFLFAVSYVANGGQNLFVLLFVIVYGAVIVVGIIKSTCEFLEDYYSKKKSAPRK